MPLLSGDRLRAQLLHLHERGAHADPPPRQSPEFLPRRDDATVFSTMEDPEGFPRSGASSRSKQTRSKQGSFNVGAFKPLETDGRSCVGSTRPPGNWGSFGERICCFNYFQFSVTREEGSRSKHSLRENISSLNGKLTRQSEEREREWLSKNCIKLRQKLRREIGKREILTSLFKRSIRNLNLNDFSYIKQVDGQIKLREIKNQLVWRTGMEK